ncbi:nifU-like protein 4, mitochondrial isoform X2 [Macadamia integrifolia]|uniref:nifU-like protein 4, mitochondrial isoform X2 n=1 Tax=Macadamia integrifolia TaxID=60698 RepID=UPI001C4EE954|nr:nifU-like protein 4, mitochondrial isoform X2 [Macadamia integrifolia]
MKSFTKLLTRVVRRELYREDKAMFSCRRLFFVSSTRASLLQQNQNTFDASYPLKSLPTSSFNSTKWGLLGAQKRSMFIQTQPTPNPSSLMFYPGKPVMEVGSADFPNARSAMNSPLAKALYGIDGITRVFFGSDFVTVTKSDDVYWDLLKPEIFAAIMDFYTSGQPLFIDSSVAASMDTAIREDDSETVAMIKELLETRIRPAVQDDGGDIEYRGFNPETGVVKLRMQGACSGCPSSSVTLKSGIENMLMHYVQEVKGVEQELDDEEEAVNLTSQMD